jgi:hypothetical protein
MEQVPEGGLVKAFDAESNSIATIVKHMAGPSGRRPDAHHHDLRRGALGQSAAYNLDVAAGIKSQR